MEPRFHYAPISEAITELRKKGYNEDFSLKEHCIEHKGICFGPHEFEIQDIYRYEGDSDPADEAVVYAIESKSGLKGVLVTGYGISADPLTSEMLEKLKYSHN